MAIKEKRFRPTDTLTTIDGMHDVASTDRWGVTDPKLPIDLSSDISPAWTVQDSTLYGAAVQVGLPTGTPHSISKAGFPHADNPGRSYSIALTGSYHNGESSLPILSLQTSKLAFNDPGGFSVGVNFATGDIERWFQTTQIASQNELLATVGAGGVLPLFLGRAQQGFYRTGSFIGAYSDVVFAIVGSDPAASVYVRNLQGVGDFEVFDINIYEWRWIEVTCNAGSGFVIPEDFSKLLRLYVSKSHLDEDWDANVFAFPSASSEANNSITLNDFNVNSFAAEFGGVLDIPSIGYRGRILGNTGNEIFLLEEIPSGLNLVSQFVAYIHFPVTQVLFSVNGGTDYFMPRLDGDLEQTVTDYANASAIPTNGPTTSRDLTINPNDELVWKMIVDNRSAGPAIQSMFQAQPYVKELIFQYETSGPSVRVNERPAA